MTSTDENPKPGTDLLQNIILMTETGIELKERCILAEKCLTHLRILLSQANKAMVTLQSTSKFSLQNARKLLLTSATNSGLSKNDYDKLLSLIDRQLVDFDDIRDVDLSPESDTCCDLSYLTEKIKFLGSRQKSSSENCLQPPTSGSSKSLKCDVDDKYPENWSRDSSIDLNNVNNLPPVPEDVFTSFTSHKPRRSSSLSSLKSMRKVKLFLQRAETSDEDEGSSDTEDHDQLGQKGDSDDGSPVKKLLGNITEEAQDP